ncbi:MAG: heavy metal translocating P-type ATPase, partial [bacterium]
FLTFLGWGVMQKNWSSGALSAAAVLLISCPCALGLATPMAVAVASSRAARMGLIIKDANVFERSSKLNICMFDKTGTLTIGKPNAKEIWFETSLDQVVLGNTIAAIASQNNHPLSVALVDNFKKSGQLPAIQDYRYYSGMGMEATINGNVYHIGSTDYLLSLECQFSESADQILEKWLNEQVSIVAIAENRNCVALVALQDKIRDSARNAVARLKGMNIRCGLISGDQNEVVEEVAKQVEISDKNLLYCQTLPHEKQMVISQFRVDGHKVAMVGDGINDASALAWADVSMALATGTDVAKSAADIVLVKPDLNLVPDAIALSRATLRAIHQNLFWAFAYNAISIPLAALGLFADKGPLIASAAMGASSITVVMRSSMLAKTRLSA